MSLQSLIDIPKGLLEKLKKLLHTNPITNHCLQPYFLTNNQRPTKNDLCTPFKRRTSIQHGSYLCKLYY